MKYLAALLLLALAGPGEARPRAYLLSITGIGLGPAGQLKGFSVATWGVDIVAVCRIPSGWRIRAGRNATPDGVIEGDGSHGATWLTRDRLSELGRLVLVRLDGPVQHRARGAVPATFDGHAFLPTDDDGRDRRIKLSAANIRLTPAAHCPPPGR